MVIYTLIIGYMYPKVITWLWNKAIHIVVSMDSKVRNKVIVSVRMG